MHTRLTLLCFSLTICAHGFGQAIVSPDAAQPGFRPMLPKHVKLVEDFAQSVESKPALVNTPKYAGAPVLLADVPSVSCGHIGVVPVSPDLDPKVIVRVPEQSAARMPILKGLPPCPEDPR